MEHELIDRALARAGRGMAYGLAGAYVGAILFIVTIELIDSFLHPQDTKMFWTTQSLSDLFLLSLGGIILLSWWIIPVGVGPG